MSHPDSDRAGRAFLVGAGPGNLGLVTLRARQLIESAEVIIYDYLCNPEMLRWAPVSAEIIYAGKKSRDHTLTQEAINDLLVARTRAGKRVVRLKGGDPYVFGRGGEEAMALADAGVDFEVVPGVTSAIAAPAFAGIPVTHRDFTSTVTFVTGHEDPLKSDSALDWDRLARDPGTRVFLMGVERLRVIAETLIRGGTSADTPAALVRWGTTARQEVLAGRLGTLADEAESQRFKPPAVLIVGRVVELRRHLAWLEKLPLFGRRIVVTRTRAQSSHLVAALQESGAEVLEIPTIRTTPVPLPPKFAEKLVSLRSHYDWLVFTSPNGVNAFMAEFFAAAKDVRLLAGVRLGSVGPATSARLAEMHLQVECQPRVFTTAALAAAFTMEQIRGSRFCLPRGNLANPALADYLREAGAGAVDEWTVYRTDPETHDPSGVLAQYRELGADWITFTSSSTVDYWHQMQIHAPQTPRNASIGPVTSQRLREWGYRVDVEAEEATIPALVKAIRFAECPTLR
jgi:uroporphyrinogen III methyltransferase/synthase